MKIGEKNKRDFRKSVVSALRTLCREKHYFDYPINICIYLYAGEEDQLIFNHPITRTFKGAEIIGSDFGVTFTYSLRDAWNEAGSFLRFILFDLKGTVPTQLCSVLYVKHQKRGSARFVKLGTDTQTEIEDPDPIPSLERIQNATKTFIWTIVKTVEE